MMVSCLSMRPPAHMEKPCTSFMEQLLFPFSVPVFSKTSLSGPCSLWSYCYCLLFTPHTSLVLLTITGKNSGEKTAVAEGTGRKAEEAATTTARQDGDGSSLARSSSVLESHNSDMASMLAASSNPSMAPILPLPAQLSLFTGPPILTAALNQAIGHGHLQQPSLPSDHEGVSSHMQSMQSLLHGDEPALQPGPT